MTYPIVRLPPLAAPVDQLWHVLMDLSEQLTVPWALVGGQMVLLHAVEHGRVPPQISQDGDLIADVRSEQGAITAVVDLLTGTGFELDGISPEGLAHRYVRPAHPRSVAIDVLAPEGLGPNTNLTTTSPVEPSKYPAAPRRSNAASRSRSTTRTGAHSSRERLSSEQWSARPPRARYRATTTGTCATSPCSAPSCPTRSVSPKS